MISTGIVVYGDSAPLLKSMTQWKQSFGESPLCVVNNHPTLRSPQELDGDNSHFEFSAYRILCEKLEGDGPFIIANDTLFRNHWQKGWAKMLRLAIRRMDVSVNIVWGDIRRDGNSIPERPDPFLASWIFVIPNRAVLKQFAEVLDDLCNTELPEPSPAYASFLTWWTAPARRFRGWHGARTPEDIARKVRCIRLEHALSKSLPAAGLPIRSLGTLAPLQYAFLRIVDRLRTRMDAWSYRYFSEMK
ncbi:MAG: hypothetical protein ACOYN5_15580 [Bacteroidales bacterium]